MVTPVPLLGPFKRENDLIARKYLDVYFDTLTGLFPWAQDFGAGAFPPGERQQRALGDEGFP